MAEPAGYKFGLLACLWKESDGSGPYILDASGNPLLLGTAMGNVASGATDSGNPVKVAGVYRSTFPTLTDGQRGDLLLGSRAALAVQIHSANSTGVVGTTTVNSDAVSSASQAINALAFNYVWDGTANTRLRLAISTARLVSAANSVNATVVKAGAGNIFRIAGYNAAAAVTYLKIYNKATAPTVGTDTPVMTIALAPQADFVHEFNNGYVFTTGIGYGLTTGSGDSDTTAVAAAAVVGMCINYS